MAAKLKVLTLNPGQSNIHSNSPSIVSTEEFKYKWKIDTNYNQSIYKIQLGGRIIQLHSIREIFLIGRIYSVFLEEGIIRKIYAGQIVNSINRKQ